VKFLPFAFLLLVTSFARAQTAAAPIAEMQKWVAALDATWQETYAKEVTAPYEAEMTKLAQQYVAALDSSIQKASTAGNLDQTVVWRAERDRFALAKEVPAEDEATAPAALKQLRASWRAQAARLQKDRATRAAAVLARYDTVLAQAQKALTQQQRIDEALLLKKKREEVAARWTPAAAPLGEAVKPATPARAGAATPAAATAKTARVATRESLAKILAMGGEVRVADAGNGRSRRDVHNASDAPAKFDFFDIHFRPRKDGGAISDDDFAIMETVPPIKGLGLHGLDITDAAIEHLRGVVTPWVELDSLPKVTPAGLKLLSELPTLETVKLDAMPDPDAAIKAAVANKRLITLALNAMPVSEAALAAISTHTTMEVLNLLNAVTGVTPAGLAHLAKMRRLNTVYFEIPINDAMAAELAKLDSLQHLRIKNSQLTEVGVASLSRLRNVFDLYIDNPPVTPAALAAYKRMRALKTFTVGKQTPPDSTDKLKAALKRVEIKL
jgi:hypothetical protein